MVASISRLQSQRATRKRINLRKSKSKPIKMGKLILSSKRVGKRKSRVIIRRGKKKRLVLLKLLYNKISKGIKKNSCYHKSSTMKMKTYNFKLLSSNNWDLVDLFMSD